MKPEDYFTFVFGDIAWIFGDTMWIHDFEEGSSGTKAGLGSISEIDSL